MKATSPPSTFCLTSNPHSSSFSNSRRDRTSIIFDSMNLAWLMMLLIMATTTMAPADAGDTNPVFDPCSDAQVQRFDGFTFGLAFASRTDFFFNDTQLSPCDSRLSLSQSAKGAELALFRPKVDEISLLNISSATFNQSKSERYVVAFAGRKYAARSLPAFVADGNHTITSFNMILEFQKGILQNLFWKKLGCESCTGSSFVCLNNTDCAIKNSNCTNNICNIGIQLAFSGTDKNENVLNSWYEVANLRQYTLQSLLGST